MSLHAVVLAHRSQHLRARAVAANIARQAWEAGAGGRLLDSWAKQIPGLVQVTRTAMAVAATGSDAFVRASLAQQGARSDLAGTIDASRFAEVANDGRLLGPLLYYPAITTTDLLAKGASEADAMRRGLANLLMYVGTEIADAGRSGVQVAMLADKRVTGYYREPGAAACDRCAVLAGRWYSTFAGASFERHPHCQCSAVPAAGRGKGNPVAASPQAYFNSLTREQQDVRFGTDNAQAIRDGADVSQVVNSGRGMTGAWTTTEGTTRTGVYGGYTPKGIAGAPRLTPAAIYRLASDRDDAVAMFRAYGYLR